MLKRFTSFIHKHALLTNESKVLLAVSGGLDSMVMLNLFIRAGYRVGVAHVNFQLRGTESDRDQQFVAAYCTKAGIPFHATTVDTNNYAITHKLSTQMAARELRYKWFHELMNEQGYDLLATAHHLSDSVETVLLNVARGSGNAGLTGIPIRNDRVIRPLMFASRDELLAYAAENSVTWREDQSNATDDYQRNLIRHKIAPVMRNINPGLEATVQHAALKAAGDEELVDRAVKQWMIENVAQSGEQTKILKKGLDSLQHPEALLLRVLEPYGFNFSNVVDAIAIAQGQSGKTFQSSTHELVIDRTHLIVTPLAVKLQPVSIEAGSSSSTFGPFELIIHKQQSPQINSDSSTACLDMKKIVFPLKWRVWEDGDYFFPLGMRGRKKVSDFLVDLKVSLPDKRSVTVIESNNDIVCLPGLRIDDRFKVTSDTKAALVLELKRRK